MGHFNFGKVRKKTKLFIFAYPQQLFQIKTIASIAPGFSQGIKENDHKGL